MKRLTIAVICALLLGLGLAATAEETHETEPALETITVSATPIPLAEAAASVHVISREDLERHQAETLHDQLRHVPGFAVSQSGSQGAKTDVRVRGAEANHLLVALDGIEVNDLALGGAFDFTNLLASDLERVEIVKGAQSVLWGSDALAGVVHVITRPAAGAPGLRLLAEAGSFGTGRVEASWRYGADAQLGKLSLGVLDTNGTNISRPGEEDDGYHNVTASLAGRAAPADMVELGYTLRLAEAETEFDGTTAGLQTNAPYTTEYGQVYAGLSLSHRISDALSHSLKLGRADVKAETRDSGVSKVRGEKNTVRYQLDLRLGQQGLSLLAEREAEDFRRRAAASLFGDPNQDRELATTSLAAEYRLAFSSFNLSLGVRHDRNSDFEDANTWRANLGWRPLENTQVFVAAGAGIKNPNFTERFGFFTSFVGNPSLQPEEALSYEIGVRQGFAGGRGSLSLTLFQADLKNEINGFVFTGAGFTAENKKGESQRRGAELEVSYSPSDRLSLAAHYAYLDATEPKDGKDQDEVRRPKHTASLTASYRLASGARVAFSASHTGRQKDDFFPPWPQPRQTVILGSFTLATVSVDYPAGDQVSIGFRVENLLDEDYQQVYSYHSPGRAAYLTVKLDL